MRFVIFGLTLSSSWGNGHATLWRGLLKALGHSGHSVTFFEKDVPYYADTRDGWPLPENVSLRLFSSLHEVRSEIARELQDADVAMVTSYCGEGGFACELVLDSAAAVKVFYDLDTPVTLDALESGSAVPYLPASELAGFDLVLSYTGGRALRELQTKLNARRVMPLYGWADPEMHAPADKIDEFRSELSYLGTYASDRQETLQELFIKTARNRSMQRFAMAGAQYPDSFPWAPNIFFVRHLPPSFHPGFYCSGRATLNVTRRAMAAYGYCPSGRLFEAAACGTPIITDVWEGLESFFLPGTEILTVRTCEDVLATLALSDAELQRIGEAARERTLKNHTATARAMELEGILHNVYAGELTGSESQLVST